MNKHHWDEFFLKFIYMQIINSATAVSSKQYEGGYCRTITNQNQINTIMFCEVYNKTVLKLFKRDTNAQIPTANQSFSCQKLKENNRMLSSPLN